jgi:hypothetical protein
MLYTNVGWKKPHTVLVILGFQVEIHSGIHPPAALLDSMATRPTAPVPPSYTAPARYDPAYPPQLGPAGAGGAVDSPPSYEDAAADELAPVEGVTRHYSGVTDVNAVDLDETGRTRQGGLIGEHAPPPFDEAGPAEGGSGEESRGNY